MAEMISNDSGQKRSLNKPRKTGAVKVDMTPMVDLGFLLITFFMLTMVLSEDKAMTYNQQLDDSTVDVGDCQVLTLLIDSSARIYVYEGQDISHMRVTNFAFENGVRQTLLHKSNKVKANCGVKYNGKPKDFICLIKLLPKARYKSMVDILDEMEITDTKVYTIQEPLPDEIKAVSEKQKFIAGI